MAEEVAEEVLEAEAEETEDTGSDTEESGAVEQEVEKADWKEFLTNEAAIKAAERFSSLDDVFKSVSDMRKTLSDRIALPGKDADEKEVAKFRKAMGIPESAEGYEVSLPEGVELSDADEALIEAVKPIAFESNVPVAALSGFITKFKELEAQVLNEHRAELERHQEEAEESLRKEFGKEFDANVNIANRAMKQLGGDSLVEFLNNTEASTGGLLANQPEFVRLFASLGRKMSEDGSIAPVDREEAADLDSRINDLTAKAHAAHNRGEADAAKKLFKERDELASRLYDDQPVVGSAGRAV